LRIFSILGLGCR